MILKVRMNECKKAAAYSAALSNTASYLEDSATRDTLGYRSRDSPVSFDNGPSGRRKSAAGRFGEGAFSACVDGVSSPRHVY